MTEPLDPTKLTELFTRSEALLTPNTPPLMAVVDRAKRRRQRRRAAATCASAVSAAAAVIAIVVVINATDSAAPQPASPGGAVASSTATARPSPSQQPTSGPTTTTSKDAGDPAAYAAAAKELQDYLDTWRSDGLAAAAAKYLVPDKNSGAPVDPNYLLVLKAGTVVSYRPYRWVSTDQFTLEVEMRIELADPQASAGSGGGYFVTFTRPDSKTPYRMRLATGP